MSVILLIIFYKAFRSPLCVPTSRFVVVHNYKCPCCSKMVIFFIVFPLLISKFRTDRGSLFYFPRSGSALGVSEGFLLILLLLLRCLRLILSFTTAVCWWDCNATSAQHKSINWWMFHAKGQIWYTPWKEYPKFCMPQIWGCAEVKMATVCVHLQSVSRFKRSTLFGCSIVQSTEWSMVARKLWDILYLPMCFKI